MKGKRRILKYAAIWLTVILVVGTMLNGCSGQKQGSEEKTSTSDAGASDSTNQDSTAQDEGTVNESTETSDAGTLDKAYKIGISFSDLTNTVWAELCEEAVSYAKSQYNADATVVSFDGDPAKQVTQIENFVASGFDALIICPDDPDAVEDACQKAMKAGVEVCVYTNSMTNQDFDYNVAEYDTGYAMGQACADWIEKNDTLSVQEKIKIGILNYRVIPTVIDRENGFEAAIGERLKNAEVVIRAQCISELEGMEGAETFFQAHPDLDIIYSISGSGALGALEASNAANKITENFGIFCVDCVEGVCQALKDDSGIRVSISLGGGKKHARDMVDYLMVLLDGGEVGKDVELHNYMPIETIAKENVEEFAKSQGYTLK